MIWRWGVILLLLGHGGIVAAQASGVPKSWMLGGTAHAAGVALTVAAGVLFVGAGVALASHTSAWRALAIAGAGLSCAFFVVYFQPLILFGLGIDIALLICVGYLAWPTKTMVGA